MESTLRFERARRAPEEGQSMCGIREQRSVQLSSAAGAAAAAAAAVHEDPAASGRMKWLRSCSTSRVSTSEQDLYIASIQPSFSAGSIDVKYCVHTAGNSISP